MVHEGAETSSAGHKLVFPAPDQAPSLVYYQSQICWPKDVEKIGEDAVNIRVLHMGIRFSVSPSHHIDECFSPQHRT